MKTIKNFDNGRLSVTVKQIEQKEEILSVRPLSPDEDFSTFHPNSTETPNSNQPQENPYAFGTQTKNIGGFGITITRKLR